MISAARWLYLGLVWLYVVGIVVQVLLAGAALFGTGTSFEPHRSLGYILHLVPILLLIVGALSRVGRRVLLRNLALAVVQFIQPLLPMLQGNAPWVAALHPVLALAVFWLGLTLANEAFRLVRPTTIAPESP